MTASSTITEVEQAVTSGLQVSLAGLWAAIKDVATHPEKAAVDGSGQLILKDAALVAGIVGDFDPAAKPIAGLLELAAVAEPQIAAGIASLIALGKASNVDVNAILEATLAGRFGTGDAPHLEQEPK